MWDAGAVWVEGCSVWADHVRATCVAPHVLQHVGVEVGGVAVVVTLSEVDGSAGEVDNVAGFDGGNDAVIHLCGCETKGQKARKDN